ncbi:hypothetical protein JTB14_026652 [Gonioctena quinquepunctata]|nr:hypothetical protein JTB14_026652 [Gonioctena quinquepunctata]
MLNMNKRTENLSSAQKTELLVFLERNPALQKGKFSNDSTFEKAQGMWMKYPNTLNSLPEAHKDWRPWRKAEINIKQTGEYQKKKLKLYEEDIRAKNRIAAALENIAVYLSELKE